MALPSSGTISLVDIMTEFGATGTRSLTEFYRGGSFVPDTAANAGVPTSGTINITDFYGASAQVQTVQLQNLSIVKNTSGIAEAYYSINIDGNVHRSGIGLNSDSVAHQWLLSGSASSYQVRVSVNSGSVSGSTTGGWLALSSTRTWSVSDNVVDANDVAASITVEIRDATTLVVQATASVSLNAQAMA